ncbi:MAG: tRNA pseudouridine synthase A [Bryobacteraceae bacterium]
MRRIKLTLAYDGTDFHGWQVQPGLPTIQGHLEAVFAEIEKQAVHVAGSGRTDAGVHAMAQIAAVTIENPIPLPNLKRALNRFLPDAIRVCEVEQVDGGFIHASTQLQKRTSIESGEARSAPVSASIRPPSSLPLE